MSLTLYCSESRSATCVYPSARIQTHGVYGSLKSLIVRNCGSQFKRLRLGTVALSLVDLLVD